MTIWSDCDAITKFYDGHILNVVIFDTPAVKELEKLERRLFGNSWARFEALAKRLADRGEIHDETIFRHEFSGIYAIKANRIRAFGVFETRQDGRRFFVIFLAMKKGRASLSKVEIVKIKNRRLRFDEWRRQQT